MNRILTLLFGCPHRRTTFPRTDARGTRVVCLNCGHEMAYDLAEMKITGPLKPSARPEALGEVAAS